MTPKQIINQARSAAPLAPLARWLPQILGGPEVVDTPQCPVCHEPADQAVDRGETTICFCERCRLDWSAYSGTT